MIHEGLHPAPFACWSCGQILRGNSSSSLFEWWFLGIPWFITLFKAFWLKCLSIHCLPTRKHSHTSASFIPSSLSPIVDHPLIDYPTSWQCPLSPIIPLWLFFILSPFLYLEIHFVQQPSYLIEKDPMIMNRSYLGSQISSLSMKIGSNCTSVYNGFLSFTVINQ